MTKDQTYGGLILVVSVIIILFYLVGLAFGGALAYLLIEIPVVLAVLAILGITAWIGYTMLTTPPPAPLETELASATTTATSGTTATTGQSRVSESEDK